MSNKHIVKFGDNCFYDYYDVETFGKDGKAKIWQGYSSAVCLTESGLFLRINDKNKMITGKTAYDKITEIAKKYKNNFCCADCKKELEEYFIGKIVVAQYGTYHSYRIGAIVTDRTVENCSVIIKNSEGKQITISLKNYYLTKYKINIKHLNQPLFIDLNSIKYNDNNNTNKKKDNSQNKVIYLVPELLYLTGIEELNEKDRGDIIAKSKIQPDIKAKKIEKGFSYLQPKIKKSQSQILNNHINSYINNQNINPNKQQDKAIPKKIDKISTIEEIKTEWGISFSEKFFEVSARNLFLPELEFLRIKPEKPQITHGCFQQKKDIVGVNFDSENCALITFNPIVSLAKYDCDELCKACSYFGFQFQFPQLIKLRSTTSTELIEELKRMNISSKKKILIVVLDKVTKNFYPLIKDYIYSQLGIPSQFLLHDELKFRGGKKKQNMSYYKAALNQMVVKAQGELFRIQFGKSLESVNSMIIGIDSTTTKKGTKYVISASYNRSLNKFYTDMKTDNKTINSNESNDALILLMKNALDYFKKTNENNLPEIIIIYRQGGDERHTAKIAKNELPPILKLLGGDINEGCYKKDYKPKLTFFSVNKKTDLKFFENSSHGFKNVPMGTVIDQDVTSPDVFEYYLQCPDAERVTASPVHFLCLFNNNDEMTLDEFEDISYKQSFYYWNWPGPIRIPAALKYAEVANRFCNKYMTHEVRDDLKNCPYFI